MSAPDVLLVEQIGAVRRLVLNRPERSNALDAHLLAALPAALDAAVDDPDTSVLVIAGAGRGFCAGFDLTPGAGPRDLWADRARLRRNARVFDVLWDCPLPIVAAVHGYCVAGGADLALHCDVLVAAHDARIGYPPVRDLGVPPTNMWLYRLGPQMAKRLLLTGDSLSGREAVAIGLAVEGAPADELPDRALALAQRMARNGREALIGNKHVVNRGIDLMGRSALAAVATTEDAIAHTAPRAQAFRERAAEVGLAQAVRERDAPFQPDPPGIVSVSADGVGSDRSGGAPAGVWEDTKT